MTSLNELCVAVFNNVTEVYSDAPADLITMTTVEQLFVYSCFHWNSDMERDVKQQHVTVVRGFRAFPDTHSSQ